MTVSAASSDNRHQGAHQEEKTTNTQTRMCGLCNKSCLRKRFSDEQWEVANDRLRLCTMHASTHQHCKRCDAMVKRENFRSNASTCLRHG